ncbi:hypothetical protein DOT_0921 [Desulfosporosinus sp. OT]|nr:hypothetical protein DOT_0921 [Desulfosporosinus sp. OT]
MLDDSNLQISEVLLTLTLLFGFSGGLRGRFFKGWLRFPLAGSGFGFVEEVELLHALRIGYGITAGTILLLSIQPDHFNEPVQILGQFGNGFILSFAVRSQFCL